MIKPTLIELMNRDIDGDITAAERQYLRQELDGNAEARADYERLVLAAAALRRLPRVAPPETLKASVMADIHRSGALNRKRTFLVQNIMSHLADWWTVGLSPRFLSGALAGAAIVVVLGAILGFYGQPSLFDVKGTLAPTGESSTQVIGSYTVSAGLTSADVHTTRNHYQVIVQVKVSSPVSARIQLGFDPDDLTLVSATHNGRPLADISRSAGKVLLPPTSDGVLKVTFDDRTYRSSTIHVSVSDNNVTTTQDVVTGGDAARK